MDKRHIIRSKVTPAMLQYSGSSVGNNCVVGTLLIGASRKVYGDVDAVTPAVLAVSSHPERQFIGGIAPRLIRGNVVIDETVARENGHMGTGCKVCPTCHWRRQDAIEERSGDP